MTTSESIEYICPGCGNKMWDTDTMAYCDDCNFPISKKAYAILQKIRQERDELKENVKKLLLNKKRRSYQLRKTKEYHDRFKAQRDRAWALLDEIKHINQTSYSCRFHDELGDLHCHLFNAPSKCSQCPIDAARKELK